MPTQQFSALWTVSYHALANPTTLLAACNSDLHIILQSAEVQGMLSLAGSVHAECIKHRCCIVAATPDDLL